MISDRPTQLAANDLSHRAMSPLAAFRLILALFFVWGFLTCLNDVLLPHLKFIFGLSYAQAVIVPVTFFSTCFVFAPIASQLIGRMGYKRMMCGALFTMSAGALSFLPAVAARQFWCFLLALVILGAGITALQVAAGPYVSFLGSAEQSPSRFSLALGLNSLGTMIAPLFGGWLILRKVTPGTGVATLSHAALLAARLQAIDQIRTPYFLLGLSLAALGIAVGLSPLPQMKPSSLRTGGGEEPGHILRHGPLFFGAITSFLYAGAEIGIGSFLISYLTLPAVGDMTAHSAALLVSLYWGGATLGRLVGWKILQRYRVEAVLALCGVSAATLLSVSALSQGYVAIISVLLIGLCNAMIVPIVVMLSISGLGEDTAKASSVMVASNIGGGLVPLAMGELADRIGLHHAYLLPVVSYVFVVFYALRGSKGHRLRSVAQPAAQ
jgi:MFS transporter, FHS family, L-fucose permease